MELCSTLRLCPRRGQNGQGRLSPGKVRGAHGGMPQLSHHGGSLFSALPPMSAHLERHGDDFCKITYGPTHLLWRVWDSGLLQCRVLQTF